MKLFYQIGMIISSVILLFSCQKKQEIPFDYEVFETPIAEEFAIHDLINNEEGLWAIGGKRFDYPVILSWNGQDWEIVELPNNRGKALYAAAPLANNEGMICIGNDGNVLIKKHDATDWEYEDQHLWYWMRDIALVQDEHWAVAGEAFHGGKLFNRNVTGQWSLMDSFDFELNKIIIEDDVALLMGYGTVLKSDLSMQNWEALALEGDFFKDYAKVGNRRYIIGYEGSIWSQEGQDEWKRKRNGSAVHHKKIRFRAIEMLNSQEGFIVGDKGSILYTKNGWEDYVLYQILEFEKDDFLSIIQYQDQQLWIGASNGAMLRLAL